MQLIIILLFLIHKGHFFLMLPIPFYLPKGIGFESGRREILTHYLSGHFYQSHFYANSFIFTIN